MQVDDISRPGFSVIGGEHKVSYEIKCPTSVEMFDQAGRVYAKMRRPYGLMMFWCAMEMDDVFARGRDFGSWEAIDRTQLPYLLLASAAEGEPQQPSMPKILEALLPFLLPYSSAVRRCMEDEYHWRRMAFPFQPAEPDVLSVLYCVEAALQRRHQGSLLALLNEIPLFPVATDIINNAIEERFGVH